MTTPTSTPTEALKPTVEWLRAKFSYDSFTGHLSYRPGCKPRCARRTDNIGSKDTKGRLRIEIGGKTYAVHQIIFAMVSGAWSRNQVDHRNGCKTDNRFENLRPATNQQNSFNRIGRSRSGAKGVTLHRGRYYARIGKDGRILNLGSFESLDEAASAYRDAAILHHGEFANTSIK